MLTVYKKNGEIVSVLLKAEPMVRHELLMAQEYETGKLISFPVETIARATYHGNVLVG